MPASRTRAAPQGGKHGAFTRVSLLVCLVILGYIAFFSWLSILRHESFGSSAMDLGYTTQIVWNTLHGRFLRFSTLENARIDLPLDRFRRTDTLLAFHVELLLVPISLLYLVYESPITLLLLQTAGVAVGAWPAYRLVRERLGNELAGVVFALAYLLAPAVEGAILADFHAVSLTASLLLFALYYAQARRFVAFFACIFLAMISKEDVPILVAMIGLYIWLRLRERKVGLVTAGVGLGWFLICNRVILPYYSGLSSTPFLGRLAIFGPTLKETVSNLLREPILLFQWLLKPEIVSYLGGLLASAGFMSLFSPITLALSAPLLAVNVFSNWAWTYSEGEHYSASIVPFVMVSGIYGTEFLGRRLHSWLHIPYRRATGGLAIFVLIVSGIHHHYTGVSPLARHYHPPRITDHHRLGKHLMALIPPDASLSAQANLYPHLAHRERAYFFPAINDAQYVFLDVTSPSYPLTVEGLYLEARQLLRSGEYGVLAAQDGYLLLQKGLAPALDGDLPDAFYSFARARESAIPYPLRVRFDDALELLGYDYAILNLVQAQQLPATVTTYWRALRPIDLDYRFPLSFSRGDGAIVYRYDGGTPSTLWYPPYKWQPGEVVRMDTPILTVGRLREVMVAVTPPGASPANVGDRLTPVSATSEQHVEFYEGGTLVKLFGFP